MFFDVIELRNDSFFFRVFVVIHRSARKFIVRALIQESIKLADSNQSFFMRGVPEKTGPGKKQVIERK